MRCKVNASALLTLFLLATCLLSIECKGGRGGGSRGSSSRTSSSSRTNSRNYDYNRRSRQTAAPPRYQPPPPRPTNRQPSYTVAPIRRATLAPVRSQSQPGSFYRPTSAPVRPSPAAYKPTSGPKPSAPESSDAKVVNSQPAYNPNFKESNPNQGSASQPAHNPNYNPSGQNNAAKPPPYSPQERPPPYAPAGAPPPYSPGGQQPRPPGSSQHEIGGPPPSHSGQPPAYPGQPGAQYPKQPNAPYPQQPGATYPGVSYPRQPGAPNRQQPGSGYPQQPGASYPRQPGAPYPQQPGASYPRQPGAPYPQQPGASYPRQPGASYPQQAGSYNYPYPRQPGVNPHTLGSNVWSPGANRPAPSFMNSGGLPTGANMQSKPYKKKGFLGTIFSMGGSGHGKMKQPKYGSQMNPYGMASTGKYGKSAAMLTMLPTMGARHSLGHKGFRPGIGTGLALGLGMGMFMPSPFRMGGFGGGYGGYGHGYGSGYGHGGYGQGYGNGYGRNQHYYDINDSNYAGRCNRPLTPAHAEIHCVSTESQVNCDATCLEGHIFPDNTAKMENKCWHVTGIWRPKKNFPNCKPICHDACQNNGTCAGPDTCQCPTEYRGQHCEYRVLMCDMQKLAGPTVGWSCNHGKNETVCTIACRPPLKFETEDVPQFHCSLNGTWTPSEVPECKGEEVKTCIEKPDVGPCVQYVFPMYYYDLETGTCNTFTYGGCRGNGNRYTSGEECMRHCAGTKKDLKKISTE